MQADASNDSDIHAQIACGNPRGAFETLFDRYRNRVYGLIYSMTRNEATAEDLSQEAFVKIWKALPNFNGTASFSSWIYTIARNTTLTELAKKRPTGSMDDPDFWEGQEVPDGCRTEPTVAGEESDALALLARLPEKYRMVVTLFYLEQKSYEEVAEMLAMPMGTVKVMLHRAKKELVRIGARAQCGAAVAN